MTTSLHLLDISVGKGDSGSIAFFRSADGSPFVQRTANIFFYGNNFNREFVGPIIIPENSEVELRAVSINNNAQMTITTQIVQLASPSIITVSGEDL